MKAREEWRKTTEKICADFRLDCIASRPTRYQEILLHCLVQEVVSIRLELAFMPFFATLQRIEAKLDILAKSGRDRWGPPTVRPVFEQDNDPPPLPAMTE